MPIGPSRHLSLLAFPQAWDGTTLDINFLALPKGSPLDPLGGGVRAPFAEANLVFEANLIGSLDRLATPADAKAMGVLELEEIPSKRLELFKQLAVELDIKQRPPSRVPIRFRKALTESYRSVVGDRRRSALIVDKDEFECALHEGATDQADAPPEPPPATVTWGQAMAFALRQPRLATALGLLGKAKVTPPDPIFFASGGWLYIDLHASSEYAGDNVVARYAARIPKLSTPRSIFTAVLFPVLDVPQDFNADDVAQEAEAYGDGLTKLVHCAQSEGTGDAIQLAWDDEQVAEWLQRQVNLTPAGDLVLDAPTGISGYRVDVRLAGEQSWNSLTKIESVADLQLGPFSLGTFTGEGIIEVAPAQVSSKQKGLFWLPPYFATWRGSSLVLTDADMAKLHARPDVQNAAAGSSHLLDRDKTFVPVDDKVVPLHYGDTYEFRVRLADLTRGGPPVSDPAAEPPRNSVASLRFQRRKSPGQIEILEAPTPGSRQARIAVPRLGYPEALFTGAATFTDLEQDLDLIADDPNLAREMGIRDPDVLSVEIQVQVKLLDGDLSPYGELYRTTRTFETPEMTLAFDFQDHSTLATLSIDQPSDGSLTLPTARPVRLVLIPLGRDKEGYFANEELRRGQPVNIDVRAGASSESDLLTDPAAQPSLRSFFFQPPPPDNSVSSPAERLAAELDLDQLGLTLSGQQGKRTVVACSDELRHTLSPEGSSVTFAASSDLVQRWINVLRFDIPRDWTWDGIAPEGIVVTRTIRIEGRADETETAGTLRLPRAIASKAIKDVSADVRHAARQTTELIFFDAYDPKPKPLPPPSPARQFPAETTIEYSLQPAFIGLPQPEPVTRSILLPLTTPPSQTPRIISAGIALSEYTRALDYSSTDVRRRVLWLEFAAPPADKNDAYFVRVLARGPDPMLLGNDILLPDSVETSLPLDPEWMRAITPGQPRDENGLSAMQMVPGSGPTETRYLIPPPPDLDSSSEDLLGFFVYEVRLGHTASRWSTAQGRYGPMLRVAGVQHPAPPLICQAARSKGAVLVKAPFAAPTFNDSNLRPSVPSTALWAMLYARVRQADGMAWRNVLLSRTQLIARRAGNDPERAGLPVLYGEGAFDAISLVNNLSRMGLPPDEPLTVLAVELFGDSEEEDPLGNRLGHGRFLRVSPLISVPDAC